MARLLTFAAVTLLIVSSHTRAPGTKGKAIELCAGHYGCDIYVIDGKGFVAFVDGFIYEDSKASQETTGKLLTTLAERNCKGTTDTKKCRCTVYKPSDGTEETGRSCGFYISQEGDAQVVFPPDVSRPTTVSSVPANCKNGEIEVSQKHGAHPITLCKPLEKDV